jgi:cytochrome c-type biogenesis protein CcmH/NrfF
MTLPLAHLGHYLWILYVLPVVIVVGGILRSTVLEKRRNREDD